MKVNASFPFSFLFLFLNSLPFFGGPVVSDALYPLIQMCYLCFQGVPGPNVYIFRLVLVGHTDCATRFFRTTKQILYFFAKDMCVCERVRVCVSAQQSVRLNV